MRKQILDAQVAYFLKHDTFFPSVESGGLIIDSTNPPDQTSLENIDAVSDAINIEIPVGHHLTYQFVNYGEYFQVIVIADFAIYGGDKILIGDVKNTGEITLIPDL
ncbi:MAG: hypothetical protein H8D67_01715 [Deltaproteobacteria bacterium]|nr:hypothetical protein [Deltaproteobacteria bacterium]